jgi:hypothetical protein
MIKYSATAVSSDQSDRWTMLKIRCVRVGAACLMCMACQSAFTNSS